MKKLYTLTLCTALLTATTFAQTSRPKAHNLIRKGIIKNPQAIPITTIDNIIPLRQNIGRAPMATSTVNSSAKASAVTEFILDSTYYDLQTNRSIANRLIRNSDSTMCAVWTTSLVSPGNGATRGTGYSYWNGSAWNTSPGGRIETQRTGFPNIVVTASGHEMAISHSSTQLTLNQCYRSAKGTGSWIDNTIGTAPNNDTWSRAVVGAANGESIHVICHGTGITGVPVNGQDGPLYYYRSTDGGATFPIAQQTFPGLDSVANSGFNGDDYSIDAKGDVIAVAAGSFGTNLYLLKSTDNGTTWTNTIVLHSPLPQPYSDTVPFPDLNGDTFPDTLELPSGDVHVMIDNNNMCHLWWSSILCVNDAGIGLGYFPNALDGLYYWNESMGNSPGYIIACAPDLDSNGTISCPSGGIGIYGGKITEMPSSGIDAAGNMYLCYSTLNELADTTVYNTSHKHTYVIKSLDGGNTWTNYNDAYNIVQDPANLFEEGVYGCMAKHVDSDVYILYQRDSAPGTTSGVQSPWNNRSAVVIAKFPVTDIPAADNCGAYFALYQDTIPHNWIAVNNAWGAPPISYTWFWGDGTSSTGATPSHTYSVGGYYTVCLSVTDGNGCTSTMCDSSYFYRGDAGSTMVYINVINSTTGINEIVSKDDAFRIYPNPAHTKLFVNGGAQQITITNLLRETILEKTFAADNTAKREVDISSLSQGIYFIKSGNETKKFIKE